MNGINNYQLMQTVNNGIADMNVPITQQITSNVFNCIMPLIKNQFDMALQVNQATINSLLMQNKAQIMQIAKLSQTHQEMPRMFAVNPVNGFGYCMDRGKEKVIGKIKIKSIYNCFIKKKGIEKTIKYIGYKDETVIINDCSLIDNDKRRTDMLQHILSVNDNNECQPHNLAIFSSHAQFILPSEKKICITLPDDFAANMTKTMETEMCKALNILINIITNHISKNYAEFKKQFTNRIWNVIEKRRNEFSNNESAVSYAILAAVQWYVKDNIFQIKKLFTAEYVIAFINKIFMESPALSGTSADAVCEQFITSLNKAIRNGKLNITYHSKKMNFIEGTNQIIVKDDLLVMEEATIKNVILPAMRTTDNMCRTLKCLDECEYLHSTKKNRYPLVVYSKGKSLRPTFIAIKSNGILDSDVDRMIQESEYSEWFMPSICNENFIPVADNGIGNTAYQEFNFEKANNMHFFAIGKSDSGKTHCLVERMCSLQKLNNPIIIFDTSKSFTEDEIVEKLSVCGNSDTEKKVRKYVRNHISFHNIEKDGIPVDLLNLNYSSHIEETIRAIESIIESHNSNLGVKQKAAIYKAVSEMVKSGKTDMVTLYEKLTSDDTPFNLADQLIDTLSCFVSFKLSNKNWGEFIEENKDIIVISSHAVSASGGSGLIDMLLMSLYYYQSSQNNNQHLSIFIDEIKTQNLSSKGPISKIITESRKAHMGLNFATQYMPKSEEVNMIMENAETKVFFIFS